MGKNRQGFLSIVKGWALRCHKVVAAITKLYIINLAKLLAIPINTHARGKATKLWLSRKSGLNVEEKSVSAGMNLLFGLVVAAVVPALSVKYNPG